MPKLIKNFREVVKRGDKIIFKLTQEQEYEPSVRENLLKEWEKELKEKKEWLKKFEEHKKLAMEETSKQMDMLKEKIERDIKNLNEGIEIWKNVKDESIAGGQTLTP